MDILITGNRGSGTTFVAALMHNMGRDLGVDAHIVHPRNALTQVRGLEHVPLERILSSWQAYFFPVVKQGESRFNRTLSGMLMIDDLEVARRVAPDVQRVSLELPQVVKAPLMMTWLGLWLLAGGRRPDHVFVMIRDTLDSTLSNLRDGVTAQHDPLADRLDALAGYGFLLETLMRYHLDWSPITFPECVTNPDVMAAILGIKQEQRLEYLRVFGETANEQGIQTNPDLQERYRDVVRGMRVGPAPIGRTVGREEGDEIGYSVSPVELL